MVSTLHKSDNNNPLVKRLKHIAQRFEEEKIKHKTICEFSYNCKHSGPCHQDCFFTVKDFVESHSDEDDEDDMTVNSEETIVENEVRKTKENQCLECDFTAKNLTGLKIHNNNEHKYFCNQCDYKTTTQQMLKQHKLVYHKE